MTNRYIKNKSDKNIDLSRNQANFNKDRRLFI